MVDIESLDFSVDVLKAILWQYDKAPNLNYLLQAKQDWYDENEKEFWENWITNVFNLETADAFGLQVWSIILGQSLLTKYEVVSDEVTWGFGSDNENYDNGNFGPDQGGDNKYSLEVSRLLLRLRAYQLVSSGTVPETNRMLAALFGERGGAYLIDNHDMTQTYIFNFDLTKEERYMLNNTDVLPRPAGVGSQVILASELFFGFGSFSGGFGYSFGA